MNVRSSSIIESKCVGWNKKRHWVVYFFRDRKCKSVLRCGLILQVALKWCEISFFSTLFDRLVIAIICSQTDLFSRVFISRHFFFPDMMHNFCLISSKMLCSKHENFRIKLQVKRQEQNTQTHTYREKKRKQWINTAFYIWLLQIIVIIIGQGYIMNVENALILFYSFRNNYKQRWFILMLSMMRFRFLYKHLHFKVWTNASSMIFGKKKE